MHRSAVVCVLAIGAAIGAAASPSPFLAVLGFEVPACGTGFSFDGWVHTEPKTLGTDSIRDAKHKGVTEALEAGLTTLGGDPNGAKSAAGIKDTVQEVFKKKLDAVAHIDREFAFDGGRSETDNTINELIVIWHSRVVILLPKNDPGDKLKTHENGHVQIEESLKELARTRFTAESAKILGKVLDDATVSGMLTAVAETLKKIGKAAHDGYDTATDHGRTPGVNQAQAATNAFNAAAAANP